MLQALLSSRYPQGAWPVVILALLSLAVFVLSKLSVGTELNRYPETVYTLLAFVFIIKQRAWLKHDYGVRLLAIGLCLPLLLFVINYWQDATLAKQYFSYEQLVKLTFFVTMGIWLGGSTKRIYFFWGLALAGLFLALLQVDTIASFKNIFAGQRVDFNINNAQHTAMFFGLALILLLVYLKPIFSLNLTKALKFTIVLVWVLLFVIVVIVFIGSQTRAAWLAMALIAVVISLQLLWRLISTKHNLWLNLSLLVFLLLSSVFLAMHADKLNKRLTDESSVLTSMLQGDFDNIPMTSIGIRINTWIEASKWIAKKPLHGWGGGVRESVIQQSDFSERIKNAYGHFHNSYIEFTLAFGLCALLFLLFIFIWLNRRMWQISRQDTVYKPIWQMTFYGSLFMAVINCFESYVFFWSGVYAMALLLAPAYSLHLADVYKNAVRFKQPQPLP